MSIFVLELRCYRKMAESVARFHIADKLCQISPVNSVFMLGIPVQYVPVQNQSPDRTKNLTSRLNLFFLPLYKDLD